MLKHLLLISLIISSLLVGTNAMAREYYRFTNNEGRVILKDQVTKEMIVAGYDVLNDKGRVIKKVPPGKTLAELEEDRIKKIEDRKQEIALQEKIKRDAELLRQFSSISDIIRNRDAQILALEQRIKIQKSKSDLLKLQLEDQQRQAAIHERLGQKLPLILKNDITATMTQIDDNKANAIMLQDEKVVVAKRFQGDITRYKELESVRRTLRKKQNNADEDESLQPAVFDCLNKKDCQKAWQLAQLYAKDNASGRIEIITDTLILTSRAEKDDDLSLSFSKIPTNSNLTHIVFEVTCNNTEQGTELCKSDKVKTLRQNYLKYVKKQIPTENS